MHSRHTPVCTDDPLPGCVSLNFNRPKNMTESVQFNFKLITSNSDITVHARAVLLKGPSGEDHPKDEIGARS